VHVILKNKESATYSDVSASVVVFYCIYAVLDARDFSDDFLASVRVDRDNSVNISEILFMRFFRLSLLRKLCEEQKNLSDSKIAFDRDNEENDFNIKESKSVVNMSRVIVDFSKTHIEQPNQPHWWG
jgi:hypothetical protein